MLGIDYSLSGGLSKEQIEIIHNNALDLIKEVGINIPHGGILNILSNYNGVKINGDNVRFDYGIVKKALENASYDIPDYAKDNYLISSGAHQTLVIDLDSQKLRPSTLNDLTDLTKLCDALNTTGSAPVIPLDVPVHLQEILMHKISFEYSRYKCNDIFEHMDKPTYESANYIYELAQVAGKRFTFGVWMMSPRTFDMKNLEVLYRLIKKNIPMWIATMPIAGMTAPITILGSLQQSIFEVFAGLTMLYLVNPHAINYIAPDDAFEVDCFDMKNATFVYGTPEYVHANLYRIELMKYYQIPIIVKSLLTKAKESDVQSAFEIGVHTLITALAGARVFRCGGLLSNDELYSGAQLIIVHEVIEYIKNLLKAQEFNEERLMLDEIKEVGKGQTFINRESTLNYFKKDYWKPTLFTGTNLGQWKANGSKPINVYASEIAKKLINEHVYHIEDNIKKEMDKIIAKAKDDQKLIDSFK